MIKQNRKSDFTLLESFEIDGTPMAADACDWRIEYRTTGWNCYTVSHRQGLFQHCLPDDNGQVVVLFHQHGLPAGALRKTVWIETPNPAFPEGVQTVCLPGETGVELWDGPTDGEAGTESIFLANYLRGEKGDPFRYEDFTPEQLAALKGPQGDRGERGEQGPSGFSPVVELTDNDDGTCRLSITDATHTVSVDGLVTMEAVERLTGDIATALDGINRTSV